MNKTSENIDADQTGVELARERTEQASIVGWTVGIAAIMGVSTLASHPTWPFVVGITAVAAMVAFVCRSILKIHFESWWTGRSVILRRIIRIVLILATLTGLPVFFSFKNQTENSAQRRSNVLDIGAIEPWFHWEDVTETNVVQTAHTSSSSANFHNESSINFHSEYGIHFFTMSLCAGVVAILALTTLIRLRRWDNAKKP